MVITICQRQHGGLYYNPLCVCVCLCVSYIKQQTPSNFQTPDNVKVYFITAKVIFSFNFIVTLGGRGIMDREPIIAVLC